MGPESGSGDFHSPTQETLTKPTKPPSAGVPSGPEHFHHPSPQALTEPTKLQESTLASPLLDQTLAGRLLAELRAEVDRIRWRDFAGALPPALAAVLHDALALGEQYVREHDQETARGWDALGLLRGLVSDCISELEGITNTLRAVMEPETSPGVPPGGSSSGHAEQSADIGRR
jgi:hypothetical protein